MNNEELIRKRAELLKKTKKEQTKKRELGWLKLESIEGTISKVLSSSQSCLVTSKQKKILLDCDFDHDIMYSLIRGE